MACNVEEACNAEAAADYEQLFETTCILIQEYISLNKIHYMQPTFHSLIIKDVTSLLQQTLQDVVVEGIDKIIEDGMAFIYKHIVPPRSSGATFIRTATKVKEEEKEKEKEKKGIKIKHKSKMKAKIEYLQSVPQPEQRTPAWYTFRYNHLTASNIWKAFVSDSTRNQLIYEKCQPLSSDKSMYVNLESPMHWGQKYEPVSVKVYEKFYDTKVSDFGCIPHPTIECLAASPDGINTIENSPRFGRMLEIKNIFNREINGIPKLEYWVQMQLQLEVCNLNECDFLETRFTEYPDEATYMACPSRQKGLMMLFMKGNGQPHYEYTGGNPPAKQAPDPPEVGVTPPATTPELLYTLDSTSPQPPTTPELLYTLDPTPQPPTPARGVWGGTPQWEEEMMEKNKGFTWIKNIYWKLDQFSCVLVLRNKLWFSAALPQIQEIWQTIEREKKTGAYTLRAPKKNVNKSTNVTVKKMSADTSNIEMPSKCFITIGGLPPPAKQAP